MKDKRRDLRAYRRAAERLRHRTKKNNGRCWRCNEPFDWTLPYTDARSFTADHVTPLAVGGDILGTLKPAHRGCNSSRGDGTRENRFPTTQTW